MGRPLLALLLAAAPAVAGCVIYDSGPVDSGGFPRVEGRWTVDAAVLSSTCGFVDDERFTLRAFQNRDLLQLVVDIAGFGEVRWDGRIDEDGDFFVQHRTVFPSRAIQDDSDVEGRFGFAGRSMSATEFERITDLQTGRVCEITWRWMGDRS